MVRKIIEIDSELCNGCGLCVNACHEGAIKLVGGKAVLTRDDYCDGLGNCLPVCPTGAISFIEREAAEYDEEAVKNNLEKAQGGLLNAGFCGCPGTAAKSIERRETACETTAGEFEVNQGVSQLNQWPVQIKLVPVNAPYFENANLLIAADCTAYAYGNFHTKFMKNRIILIGCPKLDEGDYAEKLTAILMNNNIKSVTVVRMEVPCCAGLANAAISALQNCKKMLPWQVVTISVDGKILE